MSARPMIRDWRKQVRHQLLPELHGHQANALADLSFAMAVARHCHSGKLAAVAPGDTTPAATQRRLERTLANDRLDPEAAWPQLARAILEGHAGGPIILILDETPNHNDLRCLKITLAYRKRALPIRSVCYAPGGQPEPMPELDRPLVPRGGRRPARAGLCDAAGRPRAGLAAGGRRLHRAGLALCHPLARADEGADRRRGRVHGRRAGPAPQGVLVRRGGGLQEVGMAKGGGGRLLAAGLRRALAVGQRP